jgi:chaperonin cofactor prefoldin
MKRVIVEKLDLMREATNKEMKMEVAKVVETIDKTINTVDNRINSLEAKLDAKLDKIQTLISQIANGSSE